MSTKSVLNYALPMSRNHLKHIDCSQGCHYRVSRNQHTDHSKIGKHIEACICSPAFVYSSALERMLQCQTSDLPFNIRWLLKLKHRSKTALRKSNIEIGKNHSFRMR